eukprot:scaffold200694_cov31-Tisochrysis_lutea.AAC.4
MLCKRSTSARAGFCSVAAEGEEDSTSLSERPRTSPTRLSPVQLAAFVFTVPHDFEPYPPRCSAPAPA